MELLERIRWGNVARLAFLVLGLGGLAHQAGSAAGGDSKPLPPDAGLRPLEDRADRMRQAASSPRPPHGSVTAAAPPRTARTGRRWRARPPARARRPRRRPAAGSAQPVRPPAMRPRRSPAQVTLRPSPPRSSPPRPAAPPEDESEFGPE